MMLAFIVLLFSVANAQSDSERIQICLKALNKDQAQFIKTSGHYAAHVDLLDNSDKQACFGIQLRLSRHTVRDYQIQASKNDEIWQIDHKKKLLKVEPSR